MATTVRITETYDMKTSVGKIGLVGIHTPTVNQLRRLYPGLLKNHKFFRFTRCDVVGACASVLPADPLQVGVEAGDIAPEDMFNPILYKAVTNESFDTLVARVRALPAISGLGSVDGGNATPGNWSVDGNFQTYYALLAENGEWRKSMPQNGFRITNLVPLAHTILSSFGNVGSNKDNELVLGEDGETPVPVPDMEVPEVTESWGDTDGQAVYFRGRTVRMPKFPCHVSQEAWDALPFPDFPKTHVLAMVLPPARLHEFWYRMRITWTVRFEEVCSSLFACNYATTNRVGEISYGRNYTISASKEALSVGTDSVEADGVDLNKVMES